MKTFNTIHNVGRARYVVNYHDGSSAHRDGSPFFDLRIFSNKKKLQQFVKELQRQGYVSAN